MKAAGISGLLPRKRRRTTVRLPGVRVAPDLVERDFRPDGPNQTVVGRHHLHLDVGRVPVPRARPGPVLPADRRLVDGRPSALRAGRRRARDGARPTAPRPRADSPLRSGLPRRIQLVVATLDLGGLRWAGRAGWMTELTGRPAMRSPGRPSVARRADRAVFWLAIGDGMTTAEAAELAGRVGGGWRPVVPGRWRDANCHARPAVGALLVVCGAGGDRAAAERRVPACGRSPGGSGDRRRRSPGSCAATRPLAAGSSSIARRSRSGRRS